MAESKTKSVIKSKKTTIVPKSDRVAMEVTETKEDSSVLEIKKQVLTTDAKTMRDILAADERVTVKLNPESKRATSKVNIDGIEYKSYGEPEIFIVNGYNYYVPRGVMVKIPKTIADIYEQNNATVQSGYDELEDKGVLVIYEN